MRIDGSAWDVLIRAIIGGMILFPLCQALRKYDRPEKCERPRQPQSPPESTYWKEMLLYQEGREQLVLSQQRKKKD